MTRDIDRDVIRENEPDHIAYISFLNYVLFTFFPDRLSFYTFHPVSRGRHGFQLFEMMNAVFMTQGAAFVENYGCVNLSRPPDPAFQEATEERIVSRNSGPILGVSMVSITCPLFFKSRHIFLFYLKGTSCCGKRCLDRFLFTIRTAAPKKRKSTLDNRAF